MIHSVLSRPLFFLAMALICSCSERNAIGNGDILAHPAFAKLDGYYSNRPKNGGRSLWSFLGHDQAEDLTLDKMVVHVYALDDHTLNVRLIDDGRIVSGKTIAFEKEDSALTSGEAQIVPFIFLDVVGYVTKRIYLTGSDDLLVTESGSAAGHFFIFPMGGPIREMIRYERRKIVPPLTGGRSGS